MKIRNCIFIFLLTYNSIAYCSDDFNLTLIKCNGAILKYSATSELIQTREKDFIGDVQRGFYYNNKFYAVGYKNNLIQTDTNTGGAVNFLNFSDIISDYKPWRVLDVNEKTILVSADIYNFDSKKSIAEQSNYSLFKIDRETLKTENMSIPNCRNKFVSLYEKKIYYSDNKNNICSSFNQKSKKLGVKWRLPTISPDGSKLAFIERGIFGLNVCVFELTSATKKTMIRFFGNNSVAPIISWSEDCKLLAVSDNSDLFSTTIYIVDSESGKKINKIKKSYACNWFFK